MGVWCGRATCRVFFFFIFLIITCRVFNWPFRPARDPVRPVPVPQRQRHHPVRFPWPSARFLPSPGRARPRHRVRVVVVVLFLDSVSRSRFFGPRPESERAPPGRRCPVPFRRWTDNDVCASRGIRVIAGRNSWVSGIPAVSLTLVGRCLELAPFRALPYRTRRFFLPPPPTCSGTRSRCRGATYPGLGSGPRRIPQTMLVRKQWVVREPGASSEAVVAASVW